MGDGKGKLLPVYVLADESGSMRKVVGTLNDGLASLLETLLGEPMAAAKVRFSILGFADAVRERMRLADLRRESTLPALRAGGRTNYRAAFEDLLRRVPADVQALKAQGYEVHRPAVFFLSDGQPTGPDGKRDSDGWLDAHRRLTDRMITPCAPNIIACGIEQADESVIRRVATRPEWAFVAIAGSDVGSSIAKFCAALTDSVVKSGQSLSSGTNELIVEPPKGFRIPVDVV